MLKKGFLGSLLFLAFLLQNQGFSGQLKGKLRILVDKVMQPEEGWKTKEWMVKEAFEAGFNVFSPRRGFERFQEVKLVARWCQKYGIKYMPWMRGSLPAPEGKEAQGSRLVWENGAQQPLWSPNSDALWDYLQRYILQYAKLSKEYPSLIGVFLDFENYAPRRQANCYSLSYDQKVLDLFAESKGLKFPSLKKSERKAYLEKRGLHRDFALFQLSLWRERASRLRKAVDGYNPAFVFCVYPAPGTPFIREALYKAWSTEKSPLILADAVTYGRPSRFMSQRQALLENRKRLLQRRAVPEKAGINFLYIGGIDPAVRGADPEFCGRNALMISEVCHGYWVFYEGVSYKERHGEYFRWFSWANKAIKEGRFKEAFGRRESPESYLQDFFRRIRFFPPERIFSSWGGLRRYEPVRLRRENVIFLRVHSGQEVLVKLKNVPVGSLSAPLGYEVRDESGNLVVRGTVEYAQTGYVRFIATKDAVFAMVLSAGGCAYVVEESNVPLCIGHAGGGVSLIHGAEKLYFLVPRQAKSFSLEIETRGRETAKVVVFDPEGREAASCQTEPQKDRCRLKVNAKGSHGIWSLAIVKAREGILEDVRLSMSGTPPFLFLRRSDIAE